MKKNQYWLLVELDGIIKDEERIGIIRIFPPSYA